MSTPLTADGLSNSSLSTCTESGTEAVHWQSTKLTVLSRLSYILSNDVLCDVFFVVGEEGRGESIPAHRFILSISSPVFFTMFNGPIRTEDVVVVPDVDPAAFRLLLKYIYTEEINLNGDIVMSTLYAAKKYELPGLESACEEFLLQNVSHNSVLLLSQATFFGLKRLIEHCLKFIDNNAVEAFKGEAFTEMKLDLLCSILRRNTLNVSEIDLYNAVERWAVEECKRRELPPDGAARRSVLGEALFLIRFPTMKVAEFSAGPAKAGVLTDKEIVDLFIYHTSSPKPETRFPSKERELYENIRFYSKVIVFSDRYGEDLSSWNCSWNCTCFATNNPVVLKGVGIYGATNSSSRFNGTVSVFKSSIETDPVISMHVSFASERSTTSSPYVFRLLFDEHIRIDPNHNYIVKCCLSGPDHFVGDNTSIIESFTSLGTRISVFPTKKNVDKRDNIGLYMTPSRPRSNVMYPIGSRYYPTGRVATMYIHEVQAELLDSSADDEWSSLCKMAVF